MSEQKRIEEGPPVWVESCMTAEEYKVYCRKYPNVTNPPLYKVANFTNPKHGRWRFGMGSGLSAQEIAKTSKEIDSLREFHLTQEL